MLAHSKQTYMLATWSIEKRRNGWYIFKAPFFEDERPSKGPYSSIMSACLMIGRELAQEAVKRHHKR